MTNNNKKRIVFLISCTVGRDPQDLRHFVIDFVNPVFKGDGVITESIIVQFERVKYGGISKAVEFSNYAVAEFVVHNIPRDNENQNWQIEKIYR